MLVLEHNLLELYLHKYQYQLIIFSTAPFVGHMADQWSVRGIAFMSGIVGAAGMLVSAFAPNIEWVIVRYGVMY